METKDAKLPYSDDDVMKAARLNAACTEKAKREPDEYNAFLAGVAWAEYRLNAKPAEQSFDDRLVAEFVGLMGDRYGSVSGEWFVKNLPLPDGSIKAACYARDKGFTNDPACGLNRVTLERELRDRMFAKPKFDADGMTAEDRASRCTFKNEGTGGVCFAVEEAHVWDGGVGVQHRFQNETTIQANDDTSESFAVKALLSPGDKRDIYLTVEREDGSSAKVRFVRRSFRRICREFQATDGDALNG